VNKYRVNKSLQSLLALPETLKDIVWHIVRTWTKNDIGFKAAGLTYYATFAFVPLLSLLITVSSILINERFITQEINGYIAAIFNDPIAARLQDFVQSLVGADYSIALTIGGLIAFLYATTTYFARLNFVAQQVALDDDTRPNFIRNLSERISSLLYAVFIFIFIAIVSLVQTLISNLADFIIQVTGSIVGLSIVLELVATMVTLLMLAGLFATYYRAAIGKSVERRSAYVSGLLVSLSIYVLNLSLSYMLGFSAAYQDYGIFSAALSVILWAFVINTILICGAGLTTRKAPLVQSNSPGD
jgi:uncharacterized BrkB/YihY/UPF0761 family membrane protein